MNAYFYKFAKKINSTKRPSSSDSYTTKQVVLKEDTTLMNPIFRLTGVDWEWSLAYWNGYYYFIDDIVARNNNIYEVHCTMDVLGSYRGEIGSMTTFIERSASHYDSMVNDELLSSTQDIISMSAVTTNSKLDPSGLFQIIVSGVTGANAYIFRTLRDVSLFYNNYSYTADTNNFTLQGMMQQVGLSMVDVASHSTPIMWLPLNFSAEAGAGGSVQPSVGFFTFTDLQAQFINASMSKDVVSTALTFPTNVYSDFRKAHPGFSRYSLYLPGVGLVDINSLDGAEEDLIVDRYLDCANGSVSYRIRHGGGQGCTVATFNGQLGIQIPCGSDSIDVGSLLTNTVGGVVSVTSGNAAGAIGSLVGVASAVTSPQSCIVGGVGNKSVVSNGVHYIVSLTNYGSKSFPTDQAGRPYYTNNQISNLSGFVKCGNASFDSACLEPIKEQINNYLNSGFYYE